MIEPARRSPDVPLAAGPVVDIRAGSLRVRLAAAAEDVRAAQVLRYRVFYEEMGAKPDQRAEALQRDVDAFDTVCDHLLVIDYAGDAAGEVIGTYRLIRRDAAAAHGSFYSAAEYDLAPIVEYPGEILELGRSCVDARHRNRPTMQLLWRGIAAYVFHHDIALMFGCASLPGTDPATLAMPLSYLYHHHLAPPALRPCALSHRRVDMRQVAAGDLDPVRGMGLLPPLVKGYLRLGGFVGDGAVVDHQFNTTDVCIVVKTDLVTDKYYRHYERQAKEGWAA